MAYMDPTSAQEESVMRKEGKVQSYIRPLSEDIVCYDYPLALMESALSATSIIPSTLTGHDIVQVLGRAGLTILPSSYFLRTSGKGYVVFKPLAFYVAAAPQSSAFHRSSTSS